MVAVDIWLRMLIKRYLRMSAVTALTRLTPRKAADQLLAARKHEKVWLDAFAEHLDRHRAGESLARIFSVWDLSQSEAARLFGVSRQAVSKWLADGAPAERAEAIADLAAATDLLVRYLQRDRIAAVVRRPVPAFSRELSGESSVSLSGASMLDLIAKRQTRTLLEMCRNMFSFERAHA